MMIDINEDNEDLAIVWNMLEPSARQFYCIC
jgi:hypothetical protein